jgi:hypothetical protein
MRALSDLDVYQHLVRSADELDQLAARSTSLVGETALKTAAMSVRGMATAVYEHSLSDDAEAN